jgi:hypothetical protein
MPRRKQRKARAHAAHHAFNHAYSAACYGRFQKAAFRPEDSLFAVALICGLGLMAWVATVLYGLLTTFL